MEKPRGLYNNTSFAIASGRGNLFSGMQTLFGYKFNPHLGLGRGVGIERFTKLPTYSYMDEWQEWIYPPIAWNYYYNYDTYQRGGPFATPEIGVNAKVFKRFGVYQNTLLAKFFTAFSVISGASI